MSQYRESELVFDWNNADMPPSEVRDLTSRSYTKEIQDEILRDGLQAAYVLYPSIESKRRILMIDSELGIDSANIGYPGSSESQKNDVINLAKFIQEKRLTLTATCAARTHVDDIKPIIDASVVAGMPIEAGMFIRSSQLGTLVEGWDIDQVLDMIHRGIDFATQHDIPVMFVAEDSTRATPETIKRVYRAAIEAGASRICIADTVGYIKEAGVSKLFRFVKDEVIGDKEIPIDWHGHNDMGHALTNAIAAYRFGASRTHGTWLGIGERAGNIPLDQLLVNLREEGIFPDNDSFRRLNNYVQFIAGALGYQIPPNYPFFGKDVFTTATGVHASAIEKAENLELNGLAGLVYSPIDPHSIGRGYDFEVGPMSGGANVREKLKNLGLNVTPDHVIAILNYAKSVGKRLTDEDIRIIYNQMTPSGEQI